MSEAAVYIHLIVEGQTEQDFVLNILKPEFEGKKIYFSASTLGKKGGNVKFETLKKDFFSVRKKCYVSTMFDFFSYR